MMDLKTIERLQLEYDDLKFKTLKLKNFIETEYYETIPTNHQNLLNIQLSLMTAYLDVLKMRLNSVLNEK